MYEYISRFRSHTSVGASIFRVGVEGSRQVPVVAGASVWPPPAMRAISLPSQSPCHCRHISLPFSCVPFRHLPCRLGSPPLGSPSVACLSLPHSAVPSSPLLCRSLPPARSPRSRSQLPHQPVHPLKQPLPRKRTTPHDLPFPLSQICQAERLGYLGRGESALGGG
jgi:hypothetical protein